MFFLINCQVPSIVGLRNTIESLDFARVFMFPDLVKQCLFIAFH